MKKIIQKEVRICDCCKKETFKELDGHDFYNPFAGWFTLKKEQIQPSLFVDNCTTGPQEKIDWDFCSKECFYKFLNDEKID